ncbi:MAG TPA: hypothetical protein VI035_04825 [Solirubrobacterales bacterium]
MAGRGATGGLAAIGVMLLLVMPAAAAAKAKKKKVKPPPVVTATATAGTSADGEVASPTAVCPPGTVALGGGYSGEVGREAAKPTDLYVIYESRRDSPTSWRVSATREDAGTQGNSSTIFITATVYCQSPNLGAAKKPKKPKKASTAKRKKHKKPRKRTLLIAESSATGAVAERDEQSSATASCPPGLNVISGGFSVSPPPTLSGTALSFPLVWTNHATSANAWTASETTSGTTPTILRSYAYCANTSAPLALTGSGSVDAAQTGSATTAACPANRPLIGGGFDNTPIPDGGSAELAFESTGDSGGWRVSAYENSFEPASLQAIAYCR